MKKLWICLTVAAILGVGTAAGVLAQQQPRPLGRPVRAPVGLESTEKGIPNYDAR